MDASCQIIQQFLEDDISRVLVNPALRDGRGEVAGRLLANSMWARGHLLFGTSGTTGNPKWIGLSRQALLGSAAMVNTHLREVAHHRWSRSIPAFHVGGAGIICRAHLAGSEMHEMPPGWNPEIFVDALKQSGSTLLSLVPTQLHDLVQAGCEPTYGLARSSHLWPH